ncbi:hypothetical protein [Zhongshania sp. BJYM1]|uniref:hypothetical protein n=1 Tax=Zhongshania aquatica TaxID=2965069 RepID=UPI0022B4E372|nr:hypothetical protein [Marortus sp. BJYM1]
MTNNLTLKGSKEKWYPASISNLESHLNSFIVPILGFSKDKTYPLVKNLAYTLQYVEFLYKVVEDLNLSDVLHKQNIKSFVIHGAAVIEAIFQYLVVSSGHGSNTEWQSINKFSSNQYKIGTDSFKNDTEIFIKLASPLPKEMTFDQLTKKVEAKKLLGSVNTLYKDISQVRKLRNRVHLQGIDSAFDTDYNNFDNAKFEVMRRVLHGVLTSSVFGKSSHAKLFGYLAHS